MKKKMVTSPLVLMKAKNRTDNSRDEGEDSNFYRLYMMTVSTEH